jgi:hypothetical protein
VFVDGKRETKSQIKEKDTLRLKALTMEPEETAVDKQRLAKQIPMPTNAVCSERKEDHRFLPQLLILFYFASKSVARLYRTEPNGEKMRSG